MSFKLVEFTIAVLACTKDETCSELKLPFTISDIVLESDKSNADPLRADTFVARSAVSLLEADKYSAAFVPDWLTFTIIFAIEAEIFWTFKAT